MRKLRLRNLATSLSLVGVAFAFCSFASVGSKFSLKDAATLDLHELKSAELMRSLGQPIWKEIKTTKDARFELFKFAQASPVSVHARVLLLEFKDDRLNAY